MRSGAMLLSLDLPGAADPSTSALSVRGDVNENVVTLQGGAAAATHEAERMARANQEVRNAESLLSLEA